MKGSFFYFTFTPFGFFLFIRCLFPIIWCFNFLYGNNLGNQYYFLVFSHLIYLLFEAFLSIIFFKKISSIIENHREVIYINRNYNITTLFLLIILTVFFTFGSMPLLIEGGSDALVSIGETEKFSTWFIFGSIRIILIPLLLIWYFQKKIFYKVLIFIYILIFSILDGKKGGIIILLNNVFFIHYFLSKKRLTINYKLLVALTFFVCISILYAVMQFNRTIGLDTDFNSLILGFTKVVNLTYDSFTSYLEQMITMNGLKYAAHYSDQLGSFGTIKYLFNSFTKLLFGYGIEQGIGPYLNYELYGSMFPNGVNPILFFELIFIGGNIYFSILSFFILLFIFQFIYTRSKKLIISTNTNLIDTAIHFSIILFYLSLLTDILNAIRSLPFILFLLLIKYLTKIKFHI